MADGGSVSALCVPAAHFPPENRFAGLTSATPDLCLWLEARAKAYFAAGHNPEEEPYRQTQPKKIRFREATCSRGD